MKQYLNSDQTAKLIELGFEKPRTLVDKYYDFDAEDYKEVKHYSIGELIAILHQYIIPIEIHYKKGGFDYYFCLSLKVYIDGMWCTMLERKNIEPIDFFFEALVKLKKERVIW